MRVFCAFAGHDWSDPLPVATLELPKFGEFLPIYEASCRRCDVTIKGDWEHLEKNRVWKHHRGFGR